MDEYDDFNVSKMSDFGRGRSMPSLVKNTIKSILIFVWNLQISCISILKMIRQCSYIKLPLVCTNNVKRLFVLVNGPSLNQQLENNLESLKKEEVVCVNHMANSKYYCALKPRYYVMIYPGFYLDDYKVEGNVLEEMTLENIVNLTIWDMYLIVPMFARNSVGFRKKIEQNQNIKLCYINCFDFKGFSFLKKYFRERQLAAFICYNVLSASLCSAIYFGFKQVYILGADHNYHQTLRVNDDNYVVRLDPHFYDTKDASDAVIVLRHADGRKMTMYEQLQSLAKAFGEYEEIEQYAKTQNVSIYNLTPDSSLDVFKRKKLSDCFGG